jgi:hypothetical protein
VKICAICGKKTFAAGERKSVFIRSIRVISVPINVALEQLSSGAKISDHFPEPED